MKYKVIKGKHVTYGDVEANVFDSGVTQLTIADRPIELSEDQIARLLEVLGDVTEWEEWDE